MASDEATSPTPKATTLLLVRHAESEANSGAYFGSQSDSPLSARGRRQAHVLAEALRELRIHAVYASDLSRAVDTVRAVADARGLPVQTTPLLRERGVGVLTGVTFDDAKKHHPEVWAKLLSRDPDFVIPGGESQRMLAERVASFLEPLGARHPGETVVVASHGGTIHHLARQLMGIADLAAPPWIAVENASVTRFDLVDVAGKRTPKLAYLNRIFHDDGRPPL